MLCTLRRLLLGSSSCVCTARHTSSVAHNIPRARCRRQEQVYQWTPEEVSKNLLRMEEQVDNGQPLDPKQLAKLLAPIRRHR